MAETQNFSNHTRYHAPFHYVLIPLMTIYLVSAIVQLVRHPDGSGILNFILTVIVLMTMFIARGYAMKVQDRVIRLEEQLRYQRVLPADLAQRASSIPTRFVIALRFASDEELASLVTRTLDGKFNAPVEIKKAITNWRADYHRV